MPPVDDTIKETRNNIKFVEFRKFAHLAREAERFSQRIYFTTRETKLSLFLFWKHDWAKLSVNKNYVH